MNYYDNEENIMSKVTIEDLKTYGMIPEFLGRLPIIYTLAGLSKEMLIQIQSQAKAVIDKANETAELIISNAKKKAAEAAKGGSDSLSLEAPAKKKDGLSDILESHKSKMDSFFSAITKSFMGDGR